MAKLSMPKLEFDKKKAGIAGGVVVLAVAGWLAWDMFMTEPPPPPPPPPAATAKPPAPKPPAPPAGDKSADGSAAPVTVTAGSAPAATGPGASSPAPTVSAADRPAPVAPTSPVPAAAAAAVAPEPVVSSVVAGARPLTARSRLDARECLKESTNQAVHRCAERYR